MSTKVELITDVDENDFWNEAFTTFSTSFKRKQPEDEVYVSTDKKQKAQEEEKEKSTTTSHNTPDLFDLIPEYQEGEIKEVAIVPVVSSSPDITVESTAPSEKKLKDFGGYLLDSDCIQDDLLYARKNPHPRDKLIAFHEATHKYYLKGKQLSLSVTGLIHSQFADFVEQEAITMLLNGKQFPNKEEHARYRNLPIWIHPYDLSRRPKKWCEGAVLEPEENVRKKIADLWEFIREDASGRGTKMHLDCEHSMNELPVDNDTKEFSFFLEFKKVTFEKGYIPYRLEWVIYDEIMDLAGSVDAILCRSDEEGIVPRPIYLYDWKRCRVIEKDNQFQKGIGPMSHLDDCNYNHYLIQLNIYRQLLEMHYGVICFYMAILVFHPNNLGYLEFKVPVLQKEVDEIFEKRRQQVREMRQKQSIISSPSSSISNSFSSSSSSLTPQPNSSSSSSSSTSPPTASYFDETFSDDILNSIIIPS